MPALRLTNNRRRKSSHNISYTPAKPGIYGLPSRPVTCTFAPNVTPISYTAPDPDDDPSNPLSALGLGSPEEDDAAGPNVKALRAQIFPECEEGQGGRGAGAGGPQKRKRTPPGKRPSQGYIPRPPNAFMLFRAAFVKQRHVPGSIETNHGSLSKIIGTCWRQLPLEDKRVWEKRAKEEKAAHKVRFPDYRFRPVHNKNKLAASNASTAAHNANGTTTSTRREKQPTSAEEDQRCEDISQFILEGKSGDELEVAIRELDRARSMEREREQRRMQYDLELEEMESRRNSLDFHSHSQTHSLHGSRHPSPGALHLPSSLSANSSPSALHLPMPFNNGFSSHPIASPMFNNAHLGYLQRRPSSVPLPTEWFASSGPFLPGPSSSSSANTNTSGGGIAIPTIPPFISHTLSRPASPVGTISRFGQQGQGHHHTHSLQSFQGQHEHHPGHFTNPFQHQQQQQQQNYDFTAPFTPQAQPQSQLFHPAPQQAYTHTPSPRSSLGLGHRRASSAQAMLMRSWTMPMPMSMSSFDYNMAVGGDMQLDMGMGMGMQMNMDMNATGMMERDHSPLPDVDPEFFADFSFGKNEASATSSSSSSSTSSPASGSVHTKSPSIPTLPPSTSPTALPPIDTSVSISPLSVLLRENDSACTTASSTHSASTSATGSPSPSVSDVLPEMSSMVMGMGMGPLDGLYAPDSMGMYIPEHQQEHSYGLGMDMMYAYDIDPVVSSQDGASYIHSPKPLRTPTASATEANFAEDLHRDEGAYFEAA